MTSRPQTALLLVLVLSLPLAGTFADEPPPPPVAPVPAPAAPEPSPGATLPVPAAPASPAAAPVPAGPPRTPEQLEGERLVMEALKLVQAGKFAPAQESFNQALASDPDNATAHTYLCFLAFRNGDFAAARGSCDRAIAINPQIPLALLVSARIDDANAEYGKASAGYAAAAEAGLRNRRTADEGGRDVAGHARYLRALIEAKQGDHLAALTDLDRAIKIFPQNAFASYEGGLSLLALGRDEEAGNAFQSSINEKDKWFSSEAWLSPIRRYLFLDENSRFWLGVALARQGKNAEAVATLEPLASSVESRLGTEIRGQGAALPGTTRSLEGEPDLSYYRTHFELAKAQAALGEKSKAVETLRSFLRAEQTDKVSIDEARALIKTIKG